MPLYLALTDAGLAAVQAASGTDPVTIAEVGLTATPFVMAPTLTALPGEFKRIGAVAGIAAAPNVTHMSAYDTSGDVWNATGLGLFLDDGTLFAAFSQGTTIISKAGPAFALIAFDIAFQADIAGSIAFGDPIFTNPPATTEMRGLIQLATQALANAGTDTERALVTAVAKAAVLGWLLAQDGAGSGLDADLLDGQQGSWYADVIGRLGFTPLNVTAYTAADVLAKLLTVDGAGSGADADLLDGQQGSWYADIVARLGFTPLNVTAYTAADVLAKLLTVDGAGSGLDADLFDGHESGEFRRVTASSITENGGYIVYSDGFKETWGYVDIGADSYASYPLPVEHSTWVNPTLGVSVLGGDDNNSENTGIAGKTIGPGGAISIYSAENFGMRVFVQTKGV